MSTLKQRVVLPRTSFTAATVPSILREFTDHLVENGFAVYRYEWRGDVKATSYDVLTNYARMICKELKRPFVWTASGMIYRYGLLPGPADEHGNPGLHIWTKTSNDWLARIRVPKRNYLAPIVAPLLMVAKDHTSIRYSDERPPVVAMHGTGYWEFNLHGEQGRAMWDAQIEFMRTDPAVRRALRLPTK